MTEAKKTVKLALVITNLCMVLLIIVVVLLPFGVSWYVDVMHRSETLSATVMVTCYPCAPFVGVSLISLRSILKCVLRGDIFTQKNSHRLSRITACCIIISIITLIAGGYYLPFYIVAATFAFLSLITFTANGVFRFVGAGLEQNSETEEICKS